MDAGNYGNLVSGLYAWKSSLPVNGFITNCTDSLFLDSFGKCKILDGTTPEGKKDATDPANPKNLERLESVFNTNSLLLKGLVFPSIVTEKDKVQACKEAYEKYGYFLDMQSSLAYGAALKQSDTIMDQDGSVVLIARNHPGLAETEIKHILGKSVELPESIKKLYEKENDKNIIEPDIKSVKKLLKMYF